MRLVSYDETGKARFGALVADCVVDLARASAAYAGRPGVEAIPAQIEQFFERCEALYPAVKAVAALKPVFPPGETFEYSNVGYALAGHMVENALGGTWENLMRERIFKPLGMAHAGFGGTGTIGQIDQPWPHLPNGNPARTNGAAMDNPPVMGPAGIVHASLDDWARFVADHLAGAAGHGALLKPETYRHLHTPSFGGTYAFGWKVTTRPWGGGAVLTHGGSNTMNKSAAWLAPLKGFAVIACANQGGEVTTKACDDASAAMIRAHNQS